MGIIDYKTRSKNILAEIETADDISPKNKEALKQFLKAYDVSIARQSIFLANIRRFLRASQDVTKDIHDPEKINAIFRKFKEEDKYKPATLETMKNVTKRFGTWLNNGVKPQGFRDIKSDKNGYERDLRPDDMITWEEGLKIAEQTSSIQIKALFLTQLDCGFRPSELINLNYGDAKLEGDIVVFHVKEGKTGKRDVWMQRAVPQFLRWYHSHPTKRKDSPLWIMESLRRSHRKDNQLPTGGRYSYPALLSRVELMFEKAGIADKPRDFYNLRHSSCVLDKLDNVPLDLAAERHGHSVTYFTKVYGRLDLQGRLARVRSHYGKSEEKREVLTNITCVRCKSINEPNTDFCKECGNPLTPAASAKAYSEAKEMKSQLDDVQSALAVLLESNPKVKEELLKRYAEKIKKLN